MTDGSFSVDVIKRILLVLSSHGNTKKTLLAGKTGLNYAASIRYLKFLKTLRWIDYSPEPGSLISITSLGRTFRKILEGEEGEGPSDISEEILDGLLIESRGKEASSESAGSTKKADMEVNQSCLVCGSIIGNRPVTKEIDGERHIFDRRECATLFMKFRDVYGKEFPL